MRVVSFPSLHVPAPPSPNKRKVGVGVQRSAVHERSNVPARRFDGLALFEDHGRDPTRSRQLQGAKETGGTGSHNHDAGFRTILLIIAVVDGLVVVIVITRQQTAEEESLVIRVCRVDSSIDGANWRDRCRY